METAYDALRYVTLAVFILLGFLGLIQWRRQRSEAGAWLAATFGVLASVVVVSLLLPMDSDSGLVHAVEKIDVALLVLFPYFLYRFSLTFLPRKPWFWALAHILTAAAVGGAFLFRELPDEGETPSNAFEIYIIVILVQWGLLSLRVASRLWRSGRNQTTLVRFRMRTMALGALMLAAALIIAGEAGSEEEITWTDVWVQLFAAISAVLFLAGFSPPGWLRRSLIYARRDPFELTRDLTTFSPDRKTFADTVLQQGLELVGADEGFIADPSGQVLARRGLDAGTIGRLFAATPSGTEPMVIPIDGEGERSALVVPMALEEGRGCFVALSGAFTPFFGRDDMARLGDYAALTAEALERVRLTEQLQFLLDAVSDLGEGFLISEAGRLVSANDAYLHLTGYTAEELRGLSSLVELVPEEDRAAASERIQRRLAGDPVPEHFESRLVRKGGEILDVEVAIKLARWGERTRLITLVRDITPRKEGEKIRDRFISDAAHELRTPVSTLLGFAELIGSDQTPERRAEIMAGIARAGTRIRILIRNLLDLSRLQRGVSLEVQAVPVHDLISSALEASPPPEGVAVDLQGDSDLWVVVDPHRMDEVFTNLLTNAYRYGGSQVVVRTGSGNGRVSIAIEDDGPGVEEALVPSLFEPFARGSTSSKVGGSGLGLAIVRGLVEAAGGTIRYEPRTPKGARFHIELQGSDKP